MALMDDLASMFALLLQGTFWLNILARQLLEGES